MAQMFISSHLQQSEGLSYKLKNTMGPVLEFLLVATVGFLNAVDRFLQLFGVKLLSFDQVYLIQCSQKVRFCPETGLEFPPK